MKRYLKQWIRVAKRELVFTAAMLLAVCSSFFVPVSAEYLSYLDYRVLSLLFCLMFLVAGFRELGIFQYLGDLLTAHAKNVLQLELILIFLCFFSSMWITNDVALITFVPFAMEVLRAIKKEQHLIPVIVLQTIAANLGSMLTPIGNPQNLYLYSLSGMSFAEFVKEMLPLTVLSFVLVWGVTLLRGQKSRKEQIVPISTENRQYPMQKKKLCLLTVLFLLAMGTVIRVVPYGITLLIVLAVGAISFRSLFPRVDYFLLGTFAGFFVFVGNIQRIPVVRELIEHLIEGREFVLSIICSQVMSNVPATMLLSGFTSEYQKLLWGVNTGGLGTLIASLASLISYKLYAAKKEAQRGKYILAFTGYSVLFLVILCAFSGMKFFL